MKNLSKIIIASVLILGSLLLKQGIHQAQAQVNPTTDCYIFSLNQIHYNIAIVLDQRRLKNRLPIAKVVILTKAR